MAENKRNIGKCGNELQEYRTRSNSSCIKDPIASTHLILGKCVSSGQVYPNENKEEEKRPRSCNQTMSESNYFFLRHSQVTEAAKNLSEEEMRSLEIDIFKPLDFNQILFDRIKEKEEAHHFSAESGLPVASRQKSLRRVHSEDEVQEFPDRHRTRSFNQTMTWDSYFTQGIMMTEAAKNLSEEEMFLLEEDIFKPLDFYGIMFNRMSTEEKEDELSKN